MTPFNLEQIEQVMQLMKKYQVDEYASEHFSIKKTTHQVPKPRKPYTKRKKTDEEADHEFLNQHTTPPLPDSPWDQIDQSVIDQFSMTGKLG